MFIETHCHLDYLKALPLEEIRKLISEAGIQKVVTIGVDPLNLDKVQELSQNCPEVYYTQGIHPHDAKEATDVEFNKIRTRGIEPKMVAVGEIGLDYHYNNSPPDIQKTVFEKQLQIACDLDLPVVIHTREADEDTKAILKNFSSKLKRRGVIHSFTSSLDLAEFVLGEGYYIGFNGIITFKKAENVQEVVKITPTSKILFETDSPFLTPVPHRGKENAPYYLPFVAAKIAELKNVDLEKLKAEVYQNSLSCFSKLANS
ncbi:TatD family hydrolase [Peredibacter sp. HCB2-198]|uniref:TatD family hydrolase n=1 Tax=Peredibacter sp. HCB2-198 TaxID=3383025 RepID=UPI0038B63431